MTYTVSPKGIRRRMRLLLRCGVVLAWMTGGVFSQTRVTVFPVTYDAPFDTSMVWLGHALAYGLERAVAASPKDWRRVVCRESAGHEWIEAARACSTDLAVRVMLGGTRDRTTLRLELAGPPASAKVQTKTITEHFPKNWTKAVEQVIAECFKAANHKPVWKRIRSSAGLDGSWPAYEMVMRASDLMERRPELRDSIEAMLTKAVHDEPGYAVGHAALADWLRRQSRFDEAIAEYRKALNIDSTLADAARLLGDIYFYNKDDVKLAREAYRRELALSPGSASVLSQIGHTYYIQKEYGQAQAYARQAIGVQADAASAYNLLGLCAMMAKDSSQAVSYFQKAAAADPLEIPARKNLARWYEQNGRYADAVRMYTETLAADPSDASSMMAIANLDYMERRYRSAVMHYVEGVLHDPELESSRRNPVQVIQFLTRNRRELKPVTMLIDSLEDELIDLEDPRQTFRHRITLGYLKLYYVNRPSDAINDLVIARQLAPREKRIGYYLGEAYFQSGKFSQAFQYFYDYAPAAESSFDYARCLLMIGKILIRQNRFEEAQLELLKSLRMYPNAETYFHYGLALRGSQQSESALNALEKAVKLYPNYTEAHLELGNTYFAVNRYDDALASLKRAAALDSQRASLHQSLALVHLKKEDHVSAEKEIKTALQMAPRTGEALAGFHGTYGDILLKQQRYAEARGQYEIQYKADTSAVLAGYRIASTYAAVKDAKNALTWLEQAFQRGFTNFGLFDEDPLFNPVRETKTLRTVVERYRTEYNEKIMKQLKVKD